MSNDLSVFGNSANGNGQVSVYSSNNGNGQGPAGFVRDAKGRLTSIQKFSAVVQSNRNELTTTDKYSHISTAEILEVLGGQGWYPEKVVQSRVNKKDLDGFQKHLVRLRNNQFAKDVTKVGDTLPEIVVVNSHGGTSAFKLLAGIFELICSNGMVVANGPTVQSRIVHKGLTGERVKALLDETLEFFPRVFQKRDEWTNIMLTRPEQEIFAESVIDLVWSDDSQTFKVNPQELLRNHRPSQQVPTLWNTLQTAQEKVMRGGVRVQNTETHRTRRSRAVTNVDKDVKLNQALWTLAEKMAALKGGSVN